MAEKACEVLRNTKVQQIVQHGNRLVEIPYTATVNDALNTLLAKNILAVPVAAPPGQWIGAGGSMILESDKSTGAMRKQYIGMVSVLDILIHVSEDEEGENLADRLTAQVSSIIGHSIEGLSLWSISPHTSYVFSSLPHLLGFTSYLGFLNSMSNVGVGYMDSTSFHPKVQPSHYTKYVG